MQVFHPFFKRFSHLFSRSCAPPFPETPVHFPSNASTFHPKRKHVFLQTPKHFDTNALNFFVQTYISVFQKAENRPKTLLSNKINITFAALLQKTRAYLPGLAHGSGNGEARPGRMDCAPPDKRNWKFKDVKRYEITQDCLPGGRADADSRMYFLQESTLSARP